MRELILLVRFLYSIQALGYISSYIKSKCIYLRVLANITGVCETVKIMVQLLLNFYIKNKCDLSPFKNSNCFFTSLLMASSYFYIYQFTEETGRESRGMGCSKGPAGPGVDPGTSFSGRFGHVVYTPTYGVPPNTISHFVFLF